MNNLKDTSYQKLFPNNLKKYKNLNSISIQFEKDYKKSIIDKINNLAIFYNIENQSDEILSQIAWQLSVDNWREDLEKSVKIAIIKNAYWAHSKKGTKKIIEENLKNLKYPVVLKEWFEYGGDPFKFKLETSVINIEKNWVEKLTKIIGKYKNCRSVLDNISVNHENNNNLFFHNFETLEIKKEITV